MCVFFFWQRGKAVITGKRMLMRRLTFNSITPSPSPPAAPPPPHRTSLLSRRSCGSPPPYQTHHSSCVCVCRHSDPASSCVWTHSTGQSHGPESDTPTDWILNHETRNSFSTVTEIINYSGVKNNPVRSPECRLVTVPRLLKETESPL